MAVRYIQVQSISDLFAPAVRAYGTIAIIGNATTIGTTTPYKPFTSPPIIPQGKTAGDLESALAIAFNQTPGPSLVYGIPVTTPTGGAAPDWNGAFQTASKLQAQIIVLANTPVNAANTATNATPSLAGPLQQLSTYVTEISKNDGMECIGVAMLPKGSTDVKSIIPNERMVYIAHKSDQDAAAAVAGTIAGYEPPVSLLLKPVNITTDLFTPAEIATINNAETFTSGPAGQSVNWLTSPALLPGGKIYMGEGYTGDPSGGKKFIDVVRTIDDISYQLKARLIKSIGTLRISRAGLRAVIGQMEAVLQPYVLNDVLGSYVVQIPLLPLLDKNPDTLTDTELTQIHTAHANRLVEIHATVEYQGAIHRLSISLKFE